MKKILSNKILLLVLAVPYNFLIYYLGRYFSINKYHYCFETSIDSLIPFIPWTIIIYWGCYIFWIVNYLLAVKYDKSDNNRFLKAHFIAETICLIFFIFLPTTMTRADLVGDSIFIKMVKATYSIDAADNLLPSIHCFASWLCFVGVRKNDNIPKWYQIFSLIFAIIVCISTLTVKQHVIVDVIVGIVIAEISYLIAKHIGNKVNCSKNIDE